MNRRHLFTLAPAIALVACTTAQTASVNAAVTNSLAAAQAFLAQAVQFYGIAKGIALVAEVAAPQLAPVITAAIAVLDPLVAEATPLITAAAADATNVQNLATQIHVQAAALQVATANVIKVVPSV